MDARTVNGQAYKTSTLENIRHSLNRYLKSPPFNKHFDIITGPEFLDANECMKTALKELKQNGQGSINHYPKITDDDLAKLYMSVYLTPNTPSGLLNRVQMNIRLFFCRRANENFDQMTKSTFQIGKYPDGTRYVFKSEDELTKNHQEKQKALITGHMPEDKINSDLCPVRLYELYTSKLNPSNNRLWQYPRDAYQYGDESWYQNRPMGRDKLASFLKCLSQKVPLSQVYTNHSIRVTGVSILGQGFSMPQIMAVSGHRSTSSLALYQRVSDTEKQQMGNAISNKIIGQENLPMLPSTSHTLRTLPSCSSSLNPEQNVCSLVPFKRNLQSNSGQCK
jgi:hypothetical protein